MKLHLKSILLIYDQIKHNAMDSILNKILEDYWIKLELKQNIELKGNKY